ncbi:MAG: glycosyltransferase family 4 protein [Myxococcales bacterium]|nr:glycosyltransferase family 4 protein [Myxococcales bacterium]
MQQVLFDVTPLSTGSRFRGIGTYASRLAEALVALLARGEAPDLALELLTGRWTFERHAAGAALPEPRGRPLPYALYYTLKHTSLAAHLLRQRPALFHATDPKGTPEVPGIKTVVTCHDLIPTVLGPPYRPTWLPRAVTAAMDRVRYRLPDHVIAISDWTRRDVQAVTGLADERISVVHHGVDHDHYRATPERDDVDVVQPFVGSDRYFIYVGGFDERKRVPEMVAAFAHASLGDDTRLLICGNAPAAIQAALHAQADALGVRDRVVLGGFVPLEAMPALYRRSLGHVMMSTYEGFGMTLLEAMACGAPVIAADASCVPEIAGDGALLLPPMDDAALRAAFRALALDPDRRQTLCQSAVKRAATFTWERCARETLAVYRRVLDLPGEHR